MKKKYPESDYPIYEIVVDDNSVAGIRLLSIVEDPAIEMKGVFFSVEKSTKNYEFKAQEDKQIIVGPAMIPGLKILRIDDDGNKYYNIFSPETIMKLVQKFNSVGSNRRINVDHSKRMVNAYIMENWIVEDEFYDKSRKYGFDVPVGTWMVTIKIEDKDFWMNEVKELGKFGFSIEGTMGQRALNYESIEDHIDNLTDDEISIMMTFDDSYDDYPKEASENAKKALRYAEEYGWGSCGTPVGKARANQLAKGEPISRETIARMSAFERQRQNSDRELGDGCGRLMWLAWGGDAGVEWAGRKLKQIDNKLKASSNYESIEDHIDNLTDDEILIMMASKYDIPQHPNCKCYIYMGEWILGDSKSGNCEKCINAAKDYNS